MERVRKARQTTPKTTKALAAQLDAARRRELAAIKALEDANDRVQRAQAWRFRTEQLLQAAR
eukprot:9414207-Prorocentrum_lima.AAC.1